MWIILFLMNSLTFMYIVILKNSGINLMKYTLFFIILMVVKMMLC